jgi:hypothetical protein
MEKLKKQDSNPGFPDGFSKFRELLTKFQEVPTKLKKIFKNSKKP